jgi:hypothetical protein
MSAEDKQQTEQHDLKTTKPPSAPGKDINGQSTAPKPEDDERYPNMESGWNRLRRFEPATWQAVFSGLLLFATVIGYVLVQRQIDVAQRQLATANRAIDQARKR